MTTSTQPTLETLILASYQQLIGLCWALDVIERAPVTPTDSPALDKKEQETH